MPSVIAVNLANKKLVSREETFTILVGRGASLAAVCFQYVKGFG